MKRLLTILLVTLTLMTGLLLTGCSAGTPKALVPESSYDFGDVPVSRDKADTLYHDFAIHNDGTADLKLGEVTIETLEGC